MRAHSTASFGRVMLSMFGPAIVRSWTTSGYLSIERNGAEGRRECARIANDEMADLVAKHPDRFCGACASLPMNDIDAARCSRPTARSSELRFRGVEIFTDHNGRPVDAPEIFPLYEKMAGATTCRSCSTRGGTNTTADYAGEAASKYLVYTNFGWPYETSLAMARLAFGGPLEKYPTLKIVTHHAGGMIPDFHKRVQLSWDFNEMRMGYRHDGQTLTKSPVDYYRMFYCDTAIQGNTPALMCAYDFFGADHMVFATDTPVPQSTRRARHARDDRRRSRRCRSTRSAGKRSMRRTPDGCFGYPSESEDVRI